MAKVIPVPVKPVGDGNDNPGMIQADEARRITDEVNAIGSKILSGISSAIQECALSGGDTVVVVAPGEVIGMVSGALTASGYQMIATHVDGQEAFIVKW